MPSHFSRFSSPSGNLSLLFIKQECIPAGCVPLAAVAILGAGLHPSGIRHLPGPNPPGPDTPPLWTETLTYTNGNITLPQTLFAGGKYQWSERIPHAGSYWCYCNIVVFSPFELEITYYHSSKADK